MFDQPMWLAFLGAAIASGFCGLGMLSYRAGHHREPEELGLSVGLIGAAAVFAALAAFVGLPDRTGAVVAVLVLAGLTAVAIATVAARLSRRTRS